VIDGGLFEYDGAEAAGQFQRDAARSAGLRAGHQQSRAREIRQSAFPEALLRQQGNIPQVAQVDTAIGGKPARRPQRPFR
jgi:hypothetical protein